MNILGRLFKSKQDPLQKQADSLVSAAGINAISLFMTLCEKFPLLGKPDVGHWDFTVTIAGVFMGVSRLNHLHLSDAREDVLIEVVAKNLVHKYQDGILAFEDCKAFYETEYDRLASAGYDPAFLASDALGKWIVFNVLKRAPKSKDEAALVRAVGGIVTHAFFDWWK